MEKNKVVLSKVLEGLEMVSSECDCFYDLKAHDIVFIMDDLVDENEEIEELIDSDSDRFIALPDAYDIHEYSIMESFCYRLDGEAFDKMIHAIEVEVHLENLKIPHSIWEFLMIGINIERMLINK